MGERTWSGLAGEAERAASVMLPSSIVITLSCVLELPTQLVREERGTDRESLEFRGGLRAKSPVLSGQECGCLPLTGAQGWGGRWPDSATPGAPPPAERAAHLSVPEDSPFEKGVGILLFQGDREGVERLRRWCGGRGMAVGGMGMDGTGLVCHRVTGLSHCPWEREGETGSREGGEGPGCGLREVPGLPPWPTVPGPAPGKAQASRGPSLSCGSDQPSRA